mgnify:FL=1
MNAQEHNTFPVGRWTENAYPLIIDKLPRQVAPLKPRFDMLPNNHHDKKMQDKINRLIQAGAHLLTPAERRSLVIAGYAQWVESPTPDHPSRKLLRATEKCPPPTNI